MILSRNRPMSDIIPEQPTLDPLFIALGERCAETREHCGRVGRLAWMLGSACGLPANELGLLAAAARFHDIGKIGIPDAVLHKPGRLDAEERELMMTHSERGERIFAAVRCGDAGVVATAIRHHHEWFDGAGYPDGLHGEQIPLLSRIVSLADSYDAMASTRPYQRPRTHGDIMRIMREERGRKSDPRLFDLFEQLTQQQA